MSAEYFKYLKEHVRNVEKAAQWMSENLPSMRKMTHAFKCEFTDSVIEHDKSKYGLAEYGPYDAYFYGDKDEEAFNRAWLHHIHNNPHHWQHWLLMNDDGKYRYPDKVIALEMPKVYVLEMIADWWSFSWKSGNLFEVFDWYEEHKDCIILHNNTRMYVESILGEIRDTITKQSEQK